jgi:hypothetical protein
MAVMNSIHARSFLTLFIVCLSVGYGAKAAGSDYSTVSKTEADLQSLSLEYDNACREAMLETQTQVQWFKVVFEQMCTYGDGDFHRANVVMSAGNASRNSSYYADLNALLLGQMQVYRGRIEILKNLPAIMAGDLPAQGPILRINDLSAQYDFTLRLFSPCPKTYFAEPLSRNFNDCFELGQVLIHKKGKSDVIKTISGFLGVFTSKDGDGSVLDVDKTKYDGIPGFRTLDLNFDGYEDVVIYHYDVAVYLFDPAQENLVYDRKFSDIAGEFRFRDVELDASRKRIILNESGESCSSANYPKNLC